MKNLLDTISYKRRQCYENGKEPDFLILNNNSLAEIEMTLGSLRRYDYTPTDNIHYLETFLGMQIVIIDGLDENYWCVVGSKK